MHGTMRENARKLNSRVQPKNSSLSPIQFMPRTELSQLAAHGKTYEYKRFPHAALIQKIFRPLCPKRFLSFLPLSHNLRR